MLAGLLAPDLLFGPPGLAVPHLLLVLFLVRATRPRTMACSGLGRRAWRAFLLALGLAGTLLYLPGSVLLTTFDARVAVLLVVAAFLIYALSHPAGPRAFRITLGLFCACSFGSVGLLASAFILQNTEHLKLAPAPSRMAVGGYHRPQRRYRFAFGDAGLVRVFLPYRRQAETFSLLQPALPPTLTRSGVTARVAAHSPAGTIITVDWLAGPRVLDARDFHTLAATHVEGDRMEGRHHFVGVAFDPRRNQVVAVQGGCGILRYSFPTLEPVGRETCADASLRRMAPLFLGEPVEDAVLTAEDRLIITTWPGYVLAYDLSRARTTAVTWLPGPTGNAVLAHDGRSIFVSSVLTGRVYRLRLPDLAILERYTLERGIRYATRDPRSDLLLVSNYFDGGISVLDPADGDVVARVTVPPRVQWLQPSPDGSLLVVSHSQGVTLLDLKRLLAERPEEKPPVTYPYYLSRPSYFLDYDRTNLPLNAETMLAWVLAALAVISFVRREPGVP